MDSLIFCKEENQLQNVEKCIQLIRNGKAGERIHIDIVPTYIVALTGPATVPVGDQLQYRSPQASRPASITGPASAGLGQYSRNYGDSNISSTTALNSYE